MFNFGGTAIVDNDVPKQIRDLASSKANTTVLAVFLSTLETVLVKEVSYLFRSFACIKIL